MNEELKPAVDKSEDRENFVISPEHGVASPEDFREQILQESQGEVTAFIQEGEVQLAQVAARAEASGIIINQEDVGAVEELNTEAVGVQTQFTIETEGSKNDELDDQVIIEGSGNEVKESHSTLPEETPEEFVARFQAIAKAKYFKINNMSAGVILRKEKEYMREVLSGLNNSEQMRIEFIETLQRLQQNENVRQSPEKDEKTLRTIEDLIQESSLVSAAGAGGENGEIEYYKRTNQNRKFLERGGGKNDDYSYAQMMFGLPEEFVHTQEGLKYLRQKVDGKSIFLFGGGESVQDLLVSEDFHPKSVTNFDPYIKSESIDRNNNAIYRSENISASDPVISKKIEQGEISKADEIWMTYSVPFYLDNSNEIKRLMDNVAAALNEGGNARISPIMVQKTEMGGENFDTRKQTLLNSLRSLTDSKDYNITVFNDTIKIHKLKKEEIIPDPEDDEVSTENIAIGDNVSPLNQ